MAPIESRRLRSTCFLRLVVSLGLAKDAPLQLSRRQRCRRNKWKPILVMLMLLGLCSPLGAQSARMAVGIADSIAVSENVVKRLFRGIALSDADQRAATGIARRVFKAQMDSLAENRSRGVDPEPAARRLEQQRDGMLRALLRTEGARAVFDSNRARTR